MAESLKRESNQTGSKRFVANIARKASRRAAQRLNTRSEGFQLRLTSCTQYERRALVGEEQGCCFAYA